MNLIYGWTPWFTATGSAGRRIAGVALHDTETDGPVDPREGASWHYEGERDGDIVQFVHDLDIAHHVRAADRWWPPWLPTWGDFLVSRANEWTLGYEFVSSAKWRALGVPYTDDQYASFREWIAGIYAKYGRLPVTTHGFLQKDRTDPVAFDFERAGLVDSGDGKTFYYEPEPEEPPMSESDRAILDLCHALGKDASGIEGDVRRLAHYENIVIPALEQEVSDLRETLDPVVVSATVELSNGHVVRLSRP